MKLTYRILRVCACASVTPLPFPVYANRTNKMRLTLVKIVTAQKNVCLMKNTNLAMRTFYIFYKLYTTPLKMNEDKVGLNVHT